MEYRAYGIVAPGRIEGNPSLATPQEIFVSMRFSCARFEKKHTMPHRLWRKLQDQQHLPPQMFFNTDLPCPCESCFESPEASAKAIFGPWLANARNRLQERHILLVELAWIMAFLKENPRLARSNVRFALWGCETYQLLGGGDANSHFPSLQALAEEVYGPVSAPHMALHEGARYWGLLRTSPEILHPQRYLAHLNKDLSVLRSARSKLHQWLERGSSSNDEDEFRVSTDELNELCVVHAVLYKSIAVLLVSVVRSHATRFLKEKPMVPLATWWGNPPSGTGRTMSFDSAARSLYDWVDILRYQLPYTVAEWKLTDQIHMPNRDDLIIDTIVRMNRKMKRLVKIVNEYLVDAPYLPESPSELPAIRM
ncbi:hypothetical protein PG990_003094 [Apiospora arundinis]